MGGAPSGTGGSGHAGSGGATGNAGSGGGATAGSSGGGAGTSGGLAGNTGSAGSAAGASGTGGTGGSAGGTATGGSGSGGAANGGTSGGSTGGAGVGAAGAGGATGGSGGFGAVGGSTVLASNGLALTVVANTDPAVSNGLITYDIKISNLGSGTQSNVVLTNSTQNGATGVIPYSTGGVTCPGTGNANYCGIGLIATWPAFTLAAGQTQTFVYTSTVANGTANGTIIHNTSTLTFTGGSIMASRDVVVDASQSLNVSMMEDHDPVAPGDQVTYTITVGNTGTQSLPLSAAGALTAVVPVGTTFVSASGGGTASNGVVQWNVGSVNPGGNQRYSFTVAVGASAGDGTVLVSTAQVLDGTSSLARTMTDTEVRATSPLKVIIAENTDPPGPNTLATYEIRISNLGSATLSNLALVDVTQAGATGYLQYSTGGVTCPGTGNNYYCGPGLFATWPTFTLAAGQTQTFVYAVVPATATPNGSIIRNHAILSYPGGTVSHRYDLPVDGTQNLHVSMTEDHDPVAPGDQLTYTVTVGNTGTQSLPISAAGVLTAIVPTGTTFVSASNGGTASNGVVQWNLGSVNPGGNQHYTFTVTVGSSPIDGTILQSTAQIFDGASSLTRATTDTEVRAVSPLELTVAVNPDPSPASGLVTYEIRVSNLGSSTLSNLALSDVVQAGAQGYLQYTTGGATCPGTGNNYYCGPGLFAIWPTFTLAAGQTQTFLYTIATATSTPNGSVIRNQTMLNYPGGVVLQRRDVVVDGAQNLHVSMTEDHDPVAPGDQVTYTISVGNTGTQTLPVSAAGVLTAVVPTGTTFVSASNGGTASAGVVTWNLGAVNPAGNQHYTFTVGVGSSVSDGTILQSTAQIFDGAASLARAMTDTEVRAVSPLKLTVATNADPAIPGGATYYEIKVSNLGSSTLSNLALVDTTQAGTNAYLQYSTGGATCPGTGNAYYCGAGLFAIWPSFSLAPGQTETVLLTNGVGTATANGFVIRNQAMVSYPGGLVIQRQDVVVDDAQSLHLTMTADHDPAHPGDQVTYTIGVGNTGSQSLPLNAAGVLTAVVPAGTTFVSASGNGAASGGIVEWNLGSVNPGGVQRYSFTVAVGAAAASGTPLQSTAQIFDGSASLVRAQVDTEVQATSPLTLAVTVSPDPAAPQALVVYTLTVTNNGAGSYTNIALTDSTQNGANVLMADTTGSPTCPGTGNSNFCGPGLFLDWPAFSLGPGASQVFTATTQVSTGTPNGTQITNVARLDYAGGTVFATDIIAVHQ
jgi:uncharacterized repeat protein (TIGR01451 family)